MDELEQRARLIAAQKMGLVKDPDGARLPDDLWRQAIPQAERELAQESLLSERDALAAEVARLREAVTRLCHWSTQAVDLLSTVKPLEEPAVIGWVMRETAEAVSAARALVEAPR